MSEVDFVAELAGEFFDRGFNCAQSVLQATTGSVMALGLQKSSRRSGQLMDEFKDIFRTTCCRGLSRDYAG